MKTIEIELSGVLEEEEVHYFGGAYSFFERIRMKGIGSPKIVYRSGVPAFDALNEFTPTEFSFVSFELMKNGLILRLNRTQRLRCVGTRLTDLESIKLTAYQIQLQRSSWAKLQQKTVLMGVLEILEKDGTSSKFQIFTQNFDGLLKFFTKPVFADKFVYSISRDPHLEKEEELAAFLEEFI